MLLIRPVATSSVLKMATADVCHFIAPPTKNFDLTSLRATPSSSKKRYSSSLCSSIPPELAAMALGTPSRPYFDSSKHLGYVPPKKIYTMAELGKVDQGVSPNAVSDPFPLFTEDAIKQMRAEILSQRVLENCQYSSNLAQCQLRGMAPR